MTARWFLGAALVVGLAAGAVLTSHAAPHHLERPFEVLAPQATPLAHDPLEVSDEPMSPDPIKVASEGN